MRRIGPRAAGQSVSEGARQAAAAPAHRRARNHAQSAHNHAQSARMPPSQLFSMNLRDDFVKFDFIRISSGYDN